MAGYLGQRLIYESMLRKFFWLQMKSNVYKTVTMCTIYARSGPLQKFQCKILSFLASGPQKIVAIDILRPLLRTDNRNQYVIVMDGGYEKHIRPIKTHRTLLPHVANVFLDSWVVPDGILSYVLTRTSGQ